MGTDPAGFSRDGGGAGGGEAGDRAGPPRRQAGRAAPRQLGSPTAPAEGPRGTALPARHGHAQGHGHERGAKGGAGGGARAGPRARAETHAGSALPPRAEVLPAAAFRRPPRRRQSRPSAEAAAPANRTVGRRKRRCYWPAGAERPAQSGARRRGGPRPGLACRRGGAGRGGPHPPPRLAPPRCGPGSYRTRCDGHRAAVVPLVWGRRGAEGPRCWWRGGRESPGSGGRGLWLGCWPRCASGLEAIKIRVLCATVCSQPL